MAEMSGMDGNKCWVYMPLCVYPTVTHFKFHFNIQVTSFVK